MRNLITKIATSFVAATTLITGIVGISASAASSSVPNTFNVHYAVGAPGTENVTSEYNYAYVPNTDPALTVTCTMANASSNVNHCEMTVYLRTSSEDVASFSYVDQRKDIALVSRSTNYVYYTTILARTNTSSGYGNCHFYGETC